MSNTNAYCSTVVLTVEKSFIIPAPEAVIFSVETNKQLWKKTRFEYLSSFTLLTINPANNGSVVARALVYFIERSGLESIQE